MYLFAAVGLVLAAFILAQLNRIEKGVTMSADQIKQLNDKITALQTGLGGISAELQLAVSELAAAQGAATAPDPALQAAIDRLSPLVDQASQLATVIAPPAPAAPAPSTP